MQTVVRWGGQRRRRTNVLVACIFIGASISGAMAETGKEAGNPTGLDKTPRASTGRTDTLPEPISAASGASVGKPTDTTKGLESGQTATRIIKKSVPRARTIQSVLLAYLDPTTDVSGAAVSQAEAVVRGNESKGDSLRYFNLQLSDPARLSAAIKLLEEMNILFKVADPAKGKLLVMEESSADFAEIDRRLGESKLFAIRSADRTHKNVVSPKRP
jgi:hypothetical protein